MGITKSPLIRYKILDQCFRNPGRRFFIEDLIGECEKVIRETSSNRFTVSRRQILKDIAFMESKEGWEIELNRLKFGRKVFYRYKSSNYSINNMPLNGVEIDQLKSALQILNQFTGMPQFEWMDELLPKLQQGITANRRAPIMSFESNQYLKGIENLGRLFNAINYETPLDITYRDFKSEDDYIVKIHPYYLKQFNNRWFLLGFNAEKNKFDWNLAIDRIIKIEESKATYIKNNFINWEEYFEDIIGVTKPENANVETVQLKFIGDTCNYIINKPLHGSQKIAWLGSAELIVKLELIINYELIRLILSYADNVVVIEPDHLIKKVKSRLTTAALLYQ